MSEPQRMDVITFIADITPVSIRQLVNITGQAKAAGTAGITIDISSTGGDLASAFAAYHYLRSLAVPLTTRNIGNIESSAVLLYLAADTRIAFPHSRFMIHPFHWNFPAGNIFIPSIREALASLEFDSARYADIFNERTQGAKNSFDIFKCLDGNPAIIGAAHSCTCGITTEPPAEQTITAGAFYSIITDS